METDCVLAVTFQTAVHQEGSIGWSSLSLKEDKKKKNRPVEDGVGWGEGVECREGPLLSSAVAPGSLPLRHQSLGTKGAAWEVERKQGG